MPNRYVCEKLSVAMHCLAVSASSIQMRLADAGVSALIRLEPDDFDDADDRALFDAILRRLQAVEPRGGRGGIELSAEALSDSDAVALARDIADLHGRVMPMW